MPFPTSRSQVLSGSLAITDRRARSTERSEKFWFGSKLPEISEESEAVGFSTLSMDISGHQWIGLDTHDING